MELELQQKLSVLRRKQQQVDAAWKKTGNKELLEFFMEIIPRALNVERCSIFILDPVEDNVWLQCGTGVCERQISVPKWNSVVGRVVASGQPVVETDMENVVGAHDSAGLKTGFVVRDTMCVPVKGVSVDKITGAIQVLNKKGLGAEYTKEDLKLLEQLSYHLEMNIENIFLRQELAKISVQMRKQIELLESRLHQATGT
jgi:GAF domain-containing protein